jgi:hypothetical protein
MLSISAIVSLLGSVVAGVIGARKPQYGKKCTFYRFSFMNQIDVIMKNIKLKKIFFFRLIKFIYLFF